MLNLFWYERTIMRLFPLRLPVLLALILLSACSAPKLEPLMPTPLIYVTENISPVEYVDPKAQWNMQGVYYVTTRDRSQNLRDINYSNRESDYISMGVSFISFGDYSLDWQSLKDLSKQPIREKEIPLTVAGVVEAGRLHLSEKGEIDDVQGASTWLVNQINNSVATAVDKDILIYVHGAKVDFYNASAFAAQIDHFLGREMTSISFSWPTRQNIVAYALGGDKARAYRSAPALATLIEVLAKKTDVRRVNIVAWSAGGRLLTETLDILYKKHPDFSGEQWRDEYRLGSIYFAASDVPRDDFIEALPGIDKLVQRVVVSASSHDGALVSAEKMMGGSTRIGQIGDEPLSEEKRAIVLNAQRLEYIDMSHRSQERGFDITGHRYWFDHPWASTDMLLTMRTDLSPKERGLEQGIAKNHWYMPADYPKRLIDISIDSTIKLRKE